MRSSERWRATTTLVVAALLLAPQAWAQEKDGKDAPKTKAEVGKAAPDFSLKATDGKTYKLSELQDKVVVLEWISRDCPVCKNQAEDMRKTAETLAKQGVVWLAIDSTHYRNPDDNVTYLQDKKLPYVILDDRDGKVGRAYGALRTPTMYVIDKGKVAYIGSLIPQKKGEDRNYVQEAAEAVVAGKEPPIKTTSAYG